MSRSTLLALALLLLPVTATAASGESVPNQAVTAPAEPIGEGLFAAETEAALLRISERRLDARATCRTRLRKTSITTRFTVLADCFEDDLLTKQAELKVMTDTLARLVGLNDSLRQDALQTIAAESDAIDALVDGLENRIYASEADLQKARQRFIQKYVAPRWLTFTRLRADLAWQWTTWAVAILAPAAAEDAPVDEEVTAQRDCLNQAAATLQESVPASDNAAARTLLHDGLAQLASCTGLETSVH